MTNFGISFKKAREHRGLSFAQIADETRISTRFLEAIENEEFDLLPGGIFNRGFIRTYAQRVGLDPDAAVKEYEQLLKVQQPEQTIAASAQAPKDSKPDKNFYPVAIGVLVLAIIVFYVVTHEPGAPAVVPTPPQVAGTQPAQEVPPPAPLTSSVSAAPEPESVPAPTTAIALDIEAVNQTWIKVNADGSNVSPGEILEPGDSRHFSADTSLNLIVGNAGGVNLKLNDQPMKAIGKSGQVREIKVTPQNLKDFIE
jgi:cytoskeleton protein RodZ